MDGKYTWNLDPVWCSVNVEFFLSVYVLMAAAERHWAVERLSN